jgi:tRNA threonylcarbamoyladenosine biosynthesis protein TsaB
LYWDRNLKLLAIDTFCSLISVAVSDGENIFYTEKEAGMKQSEYVMDCIDDAMKKACLMPKELDAVLCMGGPGSFTGLRIGYSIAKGLALSLSIPFAPVPTLDCMIDSALNHDKIIISVIEARKNAYFFAFYENKKPISPCKDASKDQIQTEIHNILEENRHKKEVILTGQGSALLYNSLPEELKSSLILKYSNKGYAKDIITIAKSLKVLDNTDTAFLLSGPEYVRNEVWVTL